MTIIEYSIRIGTDRCEQLSFQTYDDTNLTVSKISNYAVIFARSLINRIGGECGFNECDRAPVYYDDNSACLLVTSNLEVNENNAIEILRHYTHTLCRLVCNMWNLYTPVPYILEYLTKIQDYSALNGKYARFPNIIPMNLVLYQHLPGSANEIDPPFCTNGTMIVSEENLYYNMDWDEFRKNYLFWLKHGGRYHRVFINFAPMFFEALMSYHRVPDAFRAQLEKDLDILVDTYFVETFLMNREADKYSIQAFWEIIQWYIGYPNPDYVAEHKKIAEEMLDHLYAYEDSRNCYVMTTRV